MSPNPTCPDCSGKKGVHYTQHTQLCGEEPCSCSPVWIPCTVCYATGTVSPLQLAIYNARGGPPPPPLMRGFA